MKGSALLPLFLAALTPFFVITVIVVATGFRLVVWQPPVLWQHLLGAGSVTVVASDSSGVYAVGYTFGKGSGDSGSLFLSKYDPGGGVVWNRTISETGGRFFSQMSVGPDSIYLSGENVSGGIFLKYDLAGNKLWERVDGVNSISAVPEGVYVTGGGSVREYDSSGNVAWTSKFSNDTVAFSSVYASASGVFIAYSSINLTQNRGPFLTKYSLSGNQIWTRLLSAAGGISGDSTGVYLSGPSLSKYDLNGNLDWTTQINSPDDSQVNDSWLSVDSSGIYVSAYTYRSNLYLFKYDLGGRQSWNFRLPSSVRDENNLAYAYRVSAGSGAAYVAGSVRVNGYPWAMVEKLSPDASLVFFGLNPPWSFMLLGGLIGVSAISIITFRRLRRDRARPLRVGQPRRTLPTSD